MSLPQVSECFPFDETTLVFKVLGKIFAVLSLDKPDYIIVKCDPEKAIEFRETHLEIEGAFHFNKKYWNSISFSGTLCDSFIDGLIRHSYAEVVKKMPHKTRREHPEITEIQSF